MEIKLKLPEKFYSFRLKNEQGKYRKITVLVVFFYGFYHIGMACLKPDDRNDSEYARMLCRSRIQKGMKKHAKASQDFNMFESSPNQTDKEFKKKIKPYAVHYLNTISPKFTEDV